MKHPGFTSLKESRAWIVPRVIDGAATPFRDVLTGEAYEELVAFLEDVASTHPRIRKLATRAARSLLPKKQRKLADAARDDEDEGYVVPIAGAPKVPELPAGAVDLARPELHADALRVIRVLARAYGPKSTLSFDDLVGEGWRVAVDVSKTWSGTKKTAFTTFLWTCVRRRFRDLVRKGVNRLERPISYLWVEKATDGDLEKDGDVDDFQEGMDAAATAFTLGMANESALAPDRRLGTARDAARIKDAIAKLPARQRKLIELVYYEELPMSEVGEKLGMVDRNVRQEHAKALKALHKKLAASTNVRSIKGRS